MLDKTATANNLTIHNEVKCSFTCGKNNSWRS